MADPAATAGAAVGIELPGAAGDQARAAPPALQDWLIAAVQIVIGMMALAITYHHAGPGETAPAVWLTNVGIAGAGCLAAHGSLRSRRWGLVLGVLFFAVQVLQVRGAAGGFSLMPNFNLSIAMSAGGSAVVVNLLALGMLPWAGWRAIRRWRRRV